MGQALKALPFVDYVCTGDIYSFLPNVVGNILDGKSEPELPPPVQVNLGGKAELPSGALELPIPDFDDYFELKGDGLPGCFESIPMETSKGCWWAHKHHCLFCGLPGGNVQFRSKTPQQALKEFRVQIERYSPRRIEMNDLIIDPAYFREVFPSMREFNRNTHIFYETKSHLRRDQLEVMVNAGVTSLQGGLESLSPSTLNRMSKGVSPGQNLRFLKDCEELGIKCYWNYLHSFPLESPDEILSAIPFIESATAEQPPATFQPVRIERFSPYFRNPAIYDIESVVPDRSYYSLYRDVPLDIKQFAFFFEHRQRHGDSKERKIAVNRVRDALAAWTARSQAHGRTFQSFN